MGALGKLVWLFEEHRTAAARLALLEREKEQLEKALAEIGKRLEVAIMQRNMTADDALTRFRDEILVDQPYPDGKIPDDAWLTPGEIVANQP